MTVTDDQQARRNAVTIRALWTGPAMVAVIVATAAAARAQPASTPAAARVIEQALVEAIARAEKSVVAIAVVRKQRTDPVFQLEPLPDAFGGRTLAPSDPQPTDPDFLPSAYGTGVIVDARGLILTAYHVLREDCDYYVTTPERKVYRAWTKGADPRSDLAVLSVEARDLPPISLGDAAALRKGQFVVALGNPYAIARDGQASASWGIVANLSRKAPPEPDRLDSAGKPTLHHFGTLIQTDAKLNLGTSGGPLVNLDGQMVGLCVSTAAVAGYDTAAGYAIPVDQTFRRVVDTLKQGREVEYGFLGVQPVNLTQQEVLSGLHGMRVDRVVPGTPAERFGLKPDDLITAVNGQPIYDSDGLVLEVGRLPVEAIARLSVVRNGRPRTVDVTLTKYPVRGRKIVTTLAPAWRGMRVDYPTALVDPDGRPSYGMSFSDEAVAISDVEEDSPAWAAGLRRGMLISRVGRTPVATPRQFHAAVDRAYGSVELHLADAGAGPIVVAPGG